MAGKKIQSLNFGIREALPEMQKEADNNPNATVLVRAITFSNGARWHVSQPTEVKDFKWVDVAADGQTDMGKAMELLAGALTKSAMGEERGLPPVLVLLSDGQATDTFGDGLKKLMKEPWAVKAVRIAIFIGDENDSHGIDCLQRFIGHNERKPIVVKDAPSLVRLIKWTMTDIVKSASLPASQPKGTTVTTNVPVPAPPAPTTGPIGPMDIF
jgi:uncharacterized protein YegL